MMICPSFHTITSQSSSSRMSRMVAKPNPNRNETIHPITKPIIPPKSIKTKCRIWVGSNHHSACQAVSRFLPVSRMLTRPLPLTSMFANFITYTTLCFSHFLSPGASKAARAAFGSAEFINLFHFVCQIWLKDYLRNPISVANIARAVTVIEKSNDVFPAK